MANWNKMAEAFGRAVCGVGDDNKIAKAARDVFERDLDNYRNPAAMGRAEAFNMGQESARMDNSTVRKEMGTDKWRADREGVERRMDELGDERTDEALSDDFTKEFKRAEAKAKYGNRMKELRDADITDERVAEGIGEMSDESVREEMIRRLLDENQDISDVLQWADDLYNKYK